MPFYVRNLLKTQHLFTRPDGSAIAWQPYGDPEGRDIAYVGDDLADDIGFITATRRGTLAVISEEEALGGVAAQDEAADAHNAQVKATTESALYRVADRTLNQMTCVGPSQGKKPCGAAVAQPKGDVGNRPPLCDRHKSLEKEFVPVEGDVRNEETGKVETSWKRVKVAAARK